ncbi:hypothetical protein IQ249_24710 [Lusitaniella coriacea LEGE 07157]|uniref:Uncharacterized protein n=1 Tax=Lusitaniella coriacea LEGE 07157 TaxID=945747 RepID=A0A8J7E0G9_9CYAN|nr:hypothetical protein [Lusitaniella coriacea]MBE9119062.1 hypothetical protein [Lusitaniella coriacea LEGE 07157]
MAKTTTKKTTTKAKKAALEETGLALIDDSVGLNQIPDEDFNCPNEYLKADPKKMVMLLAKYNQCSSQQAVAEIVEAFTHLVYGGRKSFTQMVAEKVSIQMETEFTRIEDEARQEMNRIADEKAEERRELELTVRQASPGLGW